MSGRGEEEEEDSALVHTSRMRRGLPFRVLFGILWQCPPTLLTFSRN